VAATIGHHGKVKIEAAPGVPCPGLLSVEIIIPTPQILGGMDGGAACSLRGGAACGLIAPALLSCRHASRAAQRGGRGAARRRQGEGRQGGGKGVAGGRIDAASDTSKQQGHGVGVRM